MKNIEHELAKFRWRTAKGKELTMQEMDTRHIFNSLKMYYNHLAAVYGLPEVWFVHQYSGHFEKAGRDPRGMVRVICIFLLELHRRKDLPWQYWEPMMQILVNLRKASGWTKKEVDEMKLLEYIE